MASTQVLTATVTDLVLSGTLNPEQGNSLTQKLDHVQRHIDRGNNTVAINVLRAFLNHITSLVQEGVLTPEEAAPLLDMVAMLIDELGVAGRAARCHLPQ